MANSTWKFQNINPNKRTIHDNDFNSVILNNNDIEQDIDFPYNLATSKKKYSKDIAKLRDAFTLYETNHSFPTFTNLDFLLPEPFLLPGCLTTLHTKDKAGQGFFIRLFISLMIKYYEQGVIFIDCTNVFPAYELIEATINTNPLLDPQLPIRAVQLSRSFNYHQATETIKEQLEPLLRDGFYYNITDSLAEKQEKKFVKPKLVIVAGLPDLYLNKESAQYLEYDGRPEWWSIFELQETIGYLRSLTLKYNCITLISSSTDPKSKIKPLGGRFLGHSSAVIVKVAMEGMAIYAELVKHPFVMSKRILLDVLKKKGKKRATLPLTIFF